MPSRLTVVGEGGGKNCLPTGEMPGLRLCLLCCAVLCFSAPEYALCVIAEMGIAAHINEAGNLDLSTRGKKKNNGDKPT